MLSNGWVAFDRAPGALVLADRDLVVIRANAAFGALVGLDPEEVVGHTGYELLRPDARDDAEKRLEALGVEDPPCTFDQRFDRSDGHDLWLQVHVGAAEDETGRRLFVARLEDTTEHRRTNDQRRSVHDAPDSAAAPAPVPARGSAPTGTLAPEDAAPGEEQLLGGLRAVADAPTVDHALRAVRELLGMDIAYVTQHTSSEQIFLATDGDAASFGVEPGTRIPLEETYCQHILAGELPAVMPDVQLVPAAAALAVTEAARVGAYASVAIRRSDGTLYGTLCAASHEQAPRLGERDVQFLAVLARMVAGELERDAVLRAQFALRVEAAGAEALLSAIEARDRYTGAHSREVVGLATAVAVELALPEDEVRDVAQVALLHDIGKLAVPDAVLAKPGPLDHDEIVVMRRHPEEGARIVAAIPELAHLARAIRAEHERWDGTGFPDRLAGEDIPIASRIVFVCDAWDAMTSDRPYRRRMTHDEALAELAEGAASQFCGVCVSALLAVLARGG